MITIFSVGKQTNISDIDFYMGHMGNVWLCSNADFMLKKQRVEWASGVSKAIPFHNKGCE